MTNIDRKWNRATENDLERVIEPLAGYICATDRPTAALKMALAVLFSQVEKTNRAADARVEAILERRLAVA